MRRLLAGLRWVRTIWRDEWREAHLTMGSGVRENRARFFLRVAPILVLLTPVMFFVGAFGKDVPG